MAIKAVLFDLDGTLLDTAADLGRALNRLRDEQDLPRFTVNDLRDSAGQGARGLVKLGFNMDETHQDYSTFTQKIFTYYREHLTDTTQLFSGMDTVLEYLNTHQIKWGIVTNKPAQFTDPLIHHLGLPAQCVISGDTFPNRKPHPEPILKACEQLGVMPQECVYVGDSLIDILASKAAGTISLAALYGYIAHDEHPRHWQADGYINHPTDLIAWLAARASQTTPA